MENIITLILLFHAFKAYNSYSYQTRQNQSKQIGPHYTIKLISINLYIHAISNTSDS